MPDLRPYQTEAIEAVRGLFQQGKRAPLLVSPTGSGKTVMLSWITAAAVARGRRVVVMAHRGELLSQLSAGLGAQGVDHGLIAPWAPANPAAPVQVASVQTLIRRLDKAPACDLLILDEAHHVIPGNMWGAVAEALAPRHTLGLTATPCRLGGEALGREAGGLFDALHIVTTPAELVQAGYLARPVVYGPDRPLDLSGLRTHKGDYETEALARLMSRRELIGDAVEHYRRHCGGLPAVAFACSVAHAHVIASQFTLEGIPADIIEGAHGRHDRERRLADLASGRIKVLVSVDLIGEGYDLPAIGAVIMLRPTQSMSLYLQQVGRAMRPMPGKDRCIILDHAANCYQHGHPLDVREWSLDEAQKRKKGKALSWQCKHCYAHNPMAEMECPECGQPREIEEKPERVLEQKAGQLIEIQAGTIKTRWDAERRGARTLEDLLHLAHRKGYSEKWAHHIWAARQAKEAEYQARRKEAHR